MVELQLEKYSYLIKGRSSHLKCSMKKYILRNFIKFTGKHLCQILFFNKVARLLRPATLLKKRLWHKCVPANFVKFLKTSFFTEHLWTTVSWNVEIPEYIRSQETLRRFSRSCHGYLIDNIQSYS